MLCIDLLGILLVLLLPGRAVYESISLPWKLSGYFSFIFSLAISFALLPFLLYLSGFLFPFNEAGIYITSIGFSILVRLYKKPAKTQETYIAFSCQKEKWFFFALSMLLLVMVFIPFVMHGTTTADGDMYKMAFSGDWYKHLTIAASAANHPAMPPQNPYLYTRPPLNYYYFLYILAAIPVKLSGHVISVYQSFLFFTLLSAFLFFNLLLLLGKIVLRNERAGLIFASMAIFVGGFDIFEVLVYGVRNLLKYNMHDITPHLFLTKIVPTRHIDFWATDWERRISSVYTSFLWVPQHTSGVMIFLMILIVFMAYEQAYPAKSESGAFWPAFPLMLLVAVLFASLMGFSAYVCAGGAIVFASLFFIRAAGKRRAWNAVLSPVIMGVLAFVLALPFLQSLRAYSGRAGFIFHISSCGDILNGALFTELMGKKSQMGHLMDIPLYYMLEFGPLLILGVVGFWMVSKKHSVYLKGDCWDLLCCALFAPFVYIFLRPPYPGPNNFQGRNALITFVLLSLFAAVAVTENKNKMFKRVSWLILFIGISANMYEFLGESVSPLFQRKVPACTASAFKWIRKNTHNNANIQLSGHVDVKDFGFFAERSMALADRFHTELFSVKNIHYLDIKAKLNNALYADAAYQAWKELKAMNVDYLLVDKKDRVLNPNKFKNSPLFSLVYENKCVFLVRLLSY